MKPKIRVLVANRPRLLRDLVLTTISEQPDIEIVGVAKTEQEILQAVERARPDFLIVALDPPGARPVICDFVLDRHPQIQIIALARDRNPSVCYRASVNIHSESMETSEERILRVLRAHAPAGEAS